MLGLLLLTLSACDPEGVDSVKLTPPVDDCNGLDDDGDGEIDEDAPLVTRYRDDDGDRYGGEPILTCDGLSYTAWEGDCDDADPTIHPGAEDVCGDAVDSDCDGSINDGVVYYDGDGDGFGSDFQVEACDAGAAYVPVGGDCDPLNPDAYPGAPEDCDGVDQDCDGLADDQDEDTPGAVEHVPDADHDGWGGDLAYGCDPDPATPAPGDCDDDNASVNPDGVEVCDGLDNDCDGAPDDDANDAIWSWADTDEDGYGDAAAPVSGCGSFTVSHSDDPTDCDDTSASIHPGAQETVCDDAADANCDGIPATADGDGDGWIGCEECDDADALQNPDVAEVALDNVDSDCDGSLDPDSVSAPRRTFRTEAAAFRGGALAVGDLDGGGHDDLFIGRPGLGDALGAAGPLRWVGAGPVFSWYWPNTADWSPAEHAAIGLVSTTGENGLALTNGALDEVSMLPELDDRSSDTSSWKVAVRQEGDAIGVPLRIGDDLTGDGTSEVLVGCPACTITASTQGAISLHSTGELLHQTFGAGDTLIVGDTGDQLGGAVAVADFDGDGVDDLAASTATAGVRRFPGPLVGDVTPADSIESLVPEGSGAALGASLDAADLDGDGYADLLIGDPDAHSGGVSVGAAWLYVGAPSGAMTEAWRLLGVTSGSEVGRAVVAAPDGAYILAPTGGVAWFPAPLSGDFTPSDAPEVMVVSDDAAREVLSGPAVGDLDGDGLSDLCLTAVYDDRYEALEFWEPLVR